MKPATKLFFSICFATVALALTACSGVKNSTGTGSGSGSGSNSGGSGSGSNFSIGGTVAGLAGTGLVLQDNATDNLAISANGSFTFKTLIATGQPYSVSVFTPPSSPSQTCTVANGSGTATANVTNVQITCSTGTASIGGSVTGLSGTGLVLQNNAGDNLSITANGTFTFKTAITLGAPYGVTVFTQPANPTQTCIITNGSGTATANVGNIQVTCSTGTLSVAGTVTGLSGSGLVLQNNAADNLTISANGAFTFKILLPSGGKYAVTILTQPSGPAQTCTVTNGSGTATVNVTNVQIVCPAVLHTIGGQVVGLVGTGSMVLQNNSGDNLPTPANGAFTFVTPIANGSRYDVSVFVAPGTQPEGCVVWGFEGIAISDVTSVSVDCGHNDWTWMDGSNQVDQKGAFTPPPATPPSPPVFDADTPGGRSYPATWTDLSGNLWLFGGNGTNFNSTSTQPEALSDMWEYVGTQNYNGGFNNFWTLISAAAAPPPRWGAVTWTDGAGDLWLFGGQDGTAFLNDLWKYNISTKTWTPIGTGSFNQNGIYGTQGTPAIANIPGSRWGADARIDSAGTVWLFGGFGYDSAARTPGLLNDLWHFDETTSQWTWISGSSTANQIGNYGTQGTPSATTVPGGRQASAAWLDASGNFWVFGGFDLDSTGHPAALNDLWEFKAGQWTWMSGANVINQKGVYGTQGVGAATNVPGARWASAAWTDLSGNLWLFGGQGFDSTGDGSLADLWEYKGGQWIWTRGPSSVSQNGNYGLTPGPILFPHSINDPGTRLAPGYWITSLGPGPFVEFWIFGGEGLGASGTGEFSLLNDLWRYLPYP